MKNFNQILFILLAIIFTSCQDDDQQFGDIIAPSNLSVSVDIVGADDENPNGDGSGVVNFTANADNAISYSFIYNSNKKTEISGNTSFIFSTLGVNTYTVTVIAHGTAGVTSSTTVDVDVLATYLPPPELITKLVGDGNKQWRIKAELAGHFGLGPVGGQIPAEWYAAGPNEKASVGMYDDRFIFSEDGTFTYITNVNNEDNTGTIFGRDGLVDELGVSGGTLNGADFENIPYNDFQETWQIIGPGGTETISLSGNGFIGYYTGGNHNYQIYDWSTPNEIIIKTTDGNSEFDWWFVLTSED